MKVRMFDLGVKNPKLKKELNLAFNKMLDHGMYFFGPELEEFEKKSAKFIGTKYAVGVASGSSALYLSLKACGIGPGDEVITTPHTWIITVNAIAECGAKPVFVDVGDDYNINPLLIEKKNFQKNQSNSPHALGWPLM
jgi:UDP-2-acetamido-2-deoxy-ribo-hexuluronate aminotransferase